MQQSNKFQKNLEECFFCTRPFTSDDYKEDKIERTKNFSAHRVCVTKAMQEYWLKIAQIPHGMDS